MPWALSSRQIQGTQKLVIRDLGLMESKPSKVPGATEDGDNKHRLEDEPTRMHRRRIDAYSKIIGVYANNDYPLS